MNYEWIKDVEDEFSDGISVSQYLTEGGYLTAEKYDQRLSVDLPNNPAEIEAFLRAVLDATGCELATAGFDGYMSPAEWGTGTRVAKRGE
jgi:hypothetical protein